MTSPALMRNLGAYSIMAGHLADHEPSDDTYVNGAAVDRQAYGNPLSCTAIFGVHFATASGMAGAKITAAIEVQGDDNSSFTSATSLKTDTYEFTWAANGDNKASLRLPVDLSGAERYVRIRIKITDSGTVTTSERVLTGCLLLHGLEYAPDSNFVAAGEASTTEPS